MEEWRRGVAEIFVLRRDLRRLTFDAFDGDAMVVGEQSRVGASQSAVSQSGNQPPRHLCHSATEGVAGFLSLHEPLEVTCKQALTGPAKERKPLRE